MDAPFARFQPAPVTPVFASLGIVERQFGIGPFTQLGQVLRAALLTRNVSPLEYFSLGLFACEGGTAADRDAFVGQRRRRQVNAAFNRGGSGLSVVDDKLYLPILLAADGLPVAETVALFHSRVRLRTLEPLASREALSGFLRRGTCYPLFGKPLGASLSLGAVSMDGHDPATDRITLSDGAAVPVEVLTGWIAAEYGASGYLLQRRIVPHPALSPVTGPAIGTVRLLTLAEGSCAPRPHYAVWKIPRPDSPADNFWRAGHMIAHVDVATGRVLRVQRGIGALAEEVHRIGDAGPRLSGIGMALPDWSEACRVACAAAAMLGDQRLVGWDIALSDRGPVIVEGNGSPDHGLYQMAARRGLMQGAFREAYEAASADAERKSTAARRRSRARRLGDMWRGLAAFRRSSDFSSVVGDRHAPSQPERPAAPPPERR